MNPKQNFLERIIAAAKERFGPVHYNAEEYKKQQVQKDYQKMPSQLKTVMDAMALQESRNGDIRIHEADQKIQSKTPGSDLNSYGLLHMGQPALDTFNKRPSGDLPYLGRNLRAKDLQGPDADATQKLIQAYRINSDMQRNGRDLYSATRYVQNYGDPQYATTTMNRYMATLPGK